MALHIHPYVLGGVEGLALHIHPYVLGGVEGLALHIQPRVLGGVEGLALHIQRRRGSGETRNSVTKHPLSPDAVWVVQVSLAAGSGSI